MKFQKYYTRIIMLLSILLILAAGAGCGEKTEKSIVLGAGGALKPVLEPLGKIFTEKTGIKIQPLYLCAAMSRPDLIEGWDVMLPGEEHFIENAVEQKLIDPDTVSIVGDMIPVIAVPKGNPENIAGIEDLTRPGLKLGMGDPDALGFQRLFDQMAKEIKIYDHIMKNSVLTMASAERLISSLLKGKADAVVNWMGVTKNFGDKVDIIRIEPQKLKYSLKYTLAPIGIVTPSKKKDLAKQYIDFVKSEQGRALFKEHGFIYTKEERSIVIGAGGALKPVLEPLGRIFTENTGIKIQALYLCAAMSRPDLIVGWDVMVPGEEHFIENAVTQKLIDPGTVSIVADMIPVIAVQKGNPEKITKLEDLAREGLKIGMGDPDAVGFQRIFDQMAKELKIYDQIMKNSELTMASAERLMVSLAKKRVDAVINWMGTAKNFQDKVEIIKIKPEKLKYSLKYTSAPIGMVTHSKKKNLATKYIDFVKSEQARVLFEKYGFIWD